MTGRGLQAWRNQHGYSQMELARALRVDIGLVVNWERAINPRFPLELYTVLNYLEAQKSQSTEEQQDTINLIQ